VEGKEMKFFIWKVGIRIRRLDAEKRVAFLANKLAQELINNGYDIRASVPDLLNIDIHVHKYNGKEMVHVQNITRDWCIKSEYTGTGFKREESE
jgi:hypothetical protein